MSLVSKKLAGLKPYSPGLSAGGVRLDANESFLPLPEKLCKAIARETAGIEFNRYPDPLATRAREAFGAYYGVDPDFVTAGNGSDELIFLLFSVLLEKGDRALLLSPDFSMYSHYCALAEIEPVILGKGPDFSFSPDELIALAKREKTRMVLFSNPCNPTSQAISAADALKIAGGLPGCIVAVDEAYMDFWDEPVVREAPDTENLIVLKTLSKIGLAAIRLGFAVAGEKLTSCMRAAKPPYNINSLSAAAGAAALWEKSSLLAAAEKIRASRDSLYGALAPLSSPDFRVLPARANFVTAVSPKAEALQGALREGGVSVRRIGGLLRVTAGAPEENVLAVKILDQCRKEGVF